MTRILLGGVALIALIGTAGAADIAPKYPVKAPPPPAPSYDWNGFYLGGYYGNSLNQATATTPGTPAGGTTEGKVDINSLGWSGGVTGGYNWQFAPAWLVGVEGDFGYFGGKRIFNEFDDPATAAGEKSSWYATARGRFGYVTGPSLLYVTAGGGWVHVTDTFGGSAVLAPTASSKTVSGAAFGGGIETKLSRNWSEKTEYLYISSSNHNFGSTSLGVAGPPTTFNHSFQVIKTGLNYRFDGAWDGLPVINGTMLPNNHNWNGFYAGGNLGIGSSMVQVAGLPPSVEGNVDINGTGFAGGGQAGYNYMLWNKYLLGVEGDFGALDIHHSVGDWNDVPAELLTEKTSWYATARARVGTTTGPALLYITGGAAWVHVRDGFAATTPPFPGDVSSKTMSGWTFGGGTEVALDQHWSARIESLYLRTGSRTHNDTIPAPFFAKFEERFTVVRAGLNYQFN